MQYQIASHHIKQIQKNKVYTQNVPFKMYIYLFFSKYKMKRLNYNYARNGNVGKKKQK
jgi:hypothetical protein